MAKLGSGLARFGSCPLRHVLRSPPLWSNTLLDPRGAQLSGAPRLACSRTPGGGPACFWMRWVGCAAFGRTPPGLVGCGGPLGFGSVGGGARLSCATLRSRWLCSGGLSAELDRPASFRFLGLSGLFRQVAGPRSSWFCLAGSRTHWVLTRLVVSLRHLCSTLSPWVLARGCHHIDCRMICSTRLGGGSRRDWYRGLLHKRGACREVTRQDSLSARTG